MELRFQQGLQVSPNNLLRDAVSDCWYTQRSRSAILPWGCPPGAPAEAGNCPTTAGSRVYRGCRSHPVLELLNRLPIYSSRALVGLHTFESLRDFPLWNIKRLCPVQAAPPIAGWPPVLELEHHSPFGPAPLQRLHPYYELFCPCALHRYSEPLRGSPCSARSLPIRATGSHVPYKSLIQIHAAFEPDAARAGLQVSALACPGVLSPSPRFRHQLYAFGSSSTVRFRSSLRTLPDGILSRLFRDAHHHRS